MEMKIREKGGTFKVTITSLAGQELAIYREGAGSLTFELREVEVFDALEFERVPVFKPEEGAAVAVQEAPATTPPAPAPQNVSGANYVGEYAKSNALFHKLSGLRREIASAESVPPYMIFHDKTLWGMVEKMPADLPTLGHINGVGKAKLEKYGNKFLSALKEGA